MNLSKRHILHRLHALLVVLLVNEYQPAFASPIQLISVSDSLIGMTQGGNGDSGAAVISPDSRFVLFGSSANDLMLLGSGNPFPILTPANLDVYLFDRSNSLTSFVSINISSNGGGNGDSLPCAVSSNGQFVLFQTSATNLVPADNSRFSQIFLRDMSAGSNFLVSVSTNGGFGNGDSTGGVMTPDGRYVAFVSSSSNLIAGDNNGITDVFVRDNLLSTTMLASKGAISSAVSNLNVSTSLGPTITPDGRYIVFFSTATNIVPGVTNIGDVYVYDTVLDATTWVSSTARSKLQSVFGTNNGVCFGYSISDDGTTISYEVSAAAYTKTAGVILRYNLNSGQTDVVNTNANAPVNAYEDIKTLDMSPDGRFIANVGNVDATGNNTAIYLWDALNGINLLVSGDIIANVSTNGYSCAPLVDSTGLHVAFISGSTNLVTNSLVGDYHLYWRDILAAKTYLADADSYGIGMGVNPASIPKMSADGRYLTFESADNTDRNRYRNVWVYDAVSNATQLVSARSPLIQSRAPNGPSAFTGFPLSTNGRVVAFTSEADNLVTNDLNGLRDVFALNLDTGSNILVSIGTDGFSAAGISSEASVSGNGRYVVFSSTAANIVSGDTNNSTDVFERDLLSNTTALVSATTNGSSGSSNSYSPTVSDDGCFILYRSLATNLTAGSFGTGTENLFLRDMTLGTNFALTALASAGSSGITSAAMTPDGHNVVFYGRVAGATSSYLYVWDSVLRARVYTNTLAGLVQVAISRDGRRLAYSTSTSLSLIDRSNSSNSATIGTGASGSFSTQNSWNFSADGSLLVYETSAAISMNDTNLLRDVYRYDVVAKTNTLISHTATGISGNGVSRSSVISPDGRFVMYRSIASNLVPGDSNGVPDIFIYDRNSSSTTLLTIGLSGTNSGNNFSFNPYFSGDGQTIVFLSAATDLVTNDYRRSAGIFAYQLFTNSTIPSFYVETVRTAPGHNPMLVWPVFAGKSYQVQFKNNSTDTAWQTLQGNITILGQTAYFTDPTASGLQRFYQIVGY